MSANGWIIWARVATYGTRHRDGGAPFGPGCFTESLTRRTSPLPLFFQHDARQELGYAVSFGDCETALNVGFHVPNTHRGAQAVGLMSSLGAGAEFSVTHLRRCGPGYITHSDLLEVSFVVPHGFCPGTQLLSIEALSGKCPPRSLGACSS
jgi:hypothetical protein